MARPHLALVLALTATTPYPKLDSRLRAVVEPQRASSGSQFAPSSHLWERDGRIHVRIATGDPTSPAFEAAGLDRQHVGRDHVEGWVPVAQLAALNGLAAVRGVRPVLPGRLRATADRATRADLARATGFDGTGVVVGVISDGKGTLPDSVVPAGCSAGSGSEGQALMEIVGTLAPGATRLFAEGLTSSQAFIDAVACLRAAGATVIVDDLGFFDEPFFEDGAVARAVAAAVAAGVSFHSAAGNDADVHYAATFRGSALHDFSGGGDTFDDIVVGPGETIDCVLQWDDPFGAADDDYDLEFYDMGGATPVLVTASDDPQTGAQDPIEIVSVVNAAQNVGRAGIAIRRAGGAVRDLKLFCFGGSAPEYVTPAGSLVGHPAVPGVVAVGAIDVSEPGQDTVQAYSSQGPVEIRFPAVESRPKPDLSAFDGVTTSAAGFATFFGTSAAAPDAAAVAALLLQKNGCLAPAEVRQHLVSTAVDIGAAGFDTVSGAGRLDALAAIASTPLPPCDDGDACTTDRCEPARGCVHAEPAGAERLTCQCDAGFTPAACADLPASLAARLRRLCRIAGRANGAGERRVRSIARRLLVGLGRTAHVTRRAAARGIIDAACGPALLARLSTTRARAVSVRGAR